MLCSIAALRACFAKRSDEKLMRLKSSLLINHEQHQSLRTVIITCLFLHYLDKNC